MPTADKPKRVRKKKDPKPLGRPFELTIEQHRELLRRWADQTADEIAFHFNVRLHTVYDYKCRLLPEDHARFKARAAAGATDDELTKEFGLTPVRVAWHRKRPVREA